MFTTVHKDFLVYLNSLNFYIIKEFILVIVNVFDIETLDNLDESIIYAFTIKRPVFVLLDVLTNLLCLDDMDIIENVCHLSVALSTVTILHSLEYNSF